jgi:hypothetical protein
MKTSAGGDDRYADELVEVVPAERDGKVQAEVIPEAITAKATIKLTSGFLKALLT